MAEEYVNLSGTYLPEYQEKYLKDLMANVYQTDEEGNVSGIASSSPLYGTPVTDAEGNPVYELDEQGNPRLDQYGEQIQQVEGGVPRPDVMRMTQAQQDAIALQKSGIGLYEDAMDLGAKTLGTGLGAYQSGLNTLGGTTQMFDPSGGMNYSPQPMGKISYEQQLAGVDPNSDVLGPPSDSTGSPVPIDETGNQPMYGQSPVDKFMNPYTQNVIDNTMDQINRQAAMARAGEDASALQAGAFGGSRSGVQRAETAGRVQEAKNRTIGDLLDRGYSSALAGAQSAFENQQNRGQQASQIFGQLGQGIAGLGVKQAALGEAAQGAAQRDVNALFNVGSIEQQQQQAEYDVQRNAAIEEAYEPFQRFSYMSDIFRGVPSTQQTMTTSSMPRPNPMNMVYNTLGGQSSSMAGLGGLRNVSGL
tara:strand:+ start:18 stop:1271 length:1254 start_codon:yes stop_codon:yes gene_type:complete